MTICSTMIRSTMIPSSMDRELSRPAGGSTAGASLTVGVLSDTHGHLYTEVKQALAGVDHIIHAGDVGSAQVLSELRGLAPVTAVRGNCDLDSWANDLPGRAVLELGGARILIGHTAARLHGKGGTGPDGAAIARPAAVAQQDPEGRFAVVITGHTHLAAVERREGVLYLNPGSAGPTRFGCPRSIARLTVRPESSRGADPDAHGVPRIEAEIVIVRS
jgi:putative phosphoesterase